MSKTLLHERAAAALDATHHVGERGPATFSARARVAAWLDGARLLESMVRSDVRHLEMVARINPPAKATGEAT